MKRVLILMLIAWSNAAKLDNTYLPPAGASTAGGSPGALTAPFGSQPSGPSAQPQQGGQQGPQGTFGSQNAYQSPESTRGFAPQSAGQSAQLQQGGQQRPQGTFGSQNTYQSPGSSGSFAPQSSGPSGQIQRGGQQGPQGAFGGQKNVYQSPAPTGGSGFVGNVAPFGTQGPSGSSTQGQTGPSGPSYPSAGRPIGPGFPVQSGIVGGPTASGSYAGSTQPSYNQGFTGGANYPTTGAGQNAGVDYSGQSGVPGGVSAPVGQSFGQQAYSQPQRPQAAQDQAAEILRYDNQIDGDSFAYSFETSNGISAEENGIATNGVQAQGEFAYTGDDGQRYSVTYTADENGYQPRGDHLPTPPPIPDEILRSIEENARAAAAGTQEGAYQEDYDSGSPQSYNGNVQRPGSSAPGSQQQYQQQFPGQAQQQQSGPSRQYGASNIPSGQYNQGATGPSQFNRPTGSSQQYNAQPAGPFASSGPEGQTSQESSGYNYDRPSQGTSTRYNQAPGPQRPGASSQFPKLGGSTQEYRPSSSAGVSTGPRPAEQQFGQRPSVTQYGGSSQSGPATQGYRDSQQFGPRSGVSQGGSQLSQPGQYTPGGSSERYTQGPQSPSAQRPSSSGMIDSQQQSSGPYQYNAPSSRPGSQQSGSGAFPAGPNQSFSNNVGAPSTQAGTGGQTFGGSRQPPSFSPEEGYKY